MKPVMQTTFNDDGNCLSACVASLLELDIGDVPNFVSIAEKEKTSHWWLLQDWLFERGYFPVVFSHDVNIKNIPVYYIASGDSPRGYSHAVIYKDEKLIHDPHPEGGGINRVWGRYYFIPTFGNKERDE